VRCSPIGKLGDRTGEAENLKFFQYYLSVKKI
jgi:hypothetical protein